MPAAYPREHIRVREETKKPDHKSCMMCSKDAGHATKEQCGKLANLRAADGAEPKTLQLNGFAQAVGQLIAVRTRFLDSGNIFHHPQPEI